jgi:hypothetical protein
VTTEEQLTKVRNDNLALINELATPKFKGLVHIDPRLGQDIMFNELIETVFPPDSEARTEMLFRVETKLNEVLLDARSKAVRAELTRSMTPSSKIMLGRN